MHRENLRTLMLARPESADELAVTLQIDNVRARALQVGHDPGVGRAAPRAARRPRPPGRHLGRPRRLHGHHLDESRRVLAAADPRFEMRVIDRAGHWVNYEAADEVNALLAEMLARRTR